MKFLKVVPLLSGVCYFLLCYYRNVFVLICFSASLPIMVEKDARTSPVSVIEIEKHVTSFNVILEN